MTEPRGERGQRRASGSSPGCAAAASGLQARWPGALRGPGARAALIAGALGLLLGRLSAPEPQPIVIAPAPAREPRPPAQARELPQPALRPAPAPRPAPAAPLAQAPVAAACEHPRGEDDSATASAPDPAVIGGALSRLRLTQDPAELDGLVGLLGALGSADPRVEQTALELAARGEDVARRAAAFNLLDALDRPAALPLVVQALIREEDPTLRSAAIYALPGPAGAVQEQLDEVVRRLREVLETDTDVETRRRAAVALGEWGRAPGAVSGLLQALRHDAAPEVRAWSAFGLELCRTNDPAVREALAQVVEDEREDAFVRENAWHALGAAAPLTPREHQVWSRFPARLARLGAQ